ncbi:UPF0280 family protein [Halocynthiibacter styelae]|uniref:UPF0280 family protein n=1 Tax=Halocynthiibacter styelae TaxID=2761955 RepID=A0A8J7LNV2_9RHOB|nr:UPF0280 family protein [Paenihalocynthiibacter styelae]MBI1492671.1 UPF0280 family protein [Paenihalocynthiibacter styelae]
MTGPQITYLPDGRLHLNHGPIDLVIMAEGPGARIGFDLATRRFQTALEELVAELPALRQATGTVRLAGQIARRMQVATQPHLPQFITPMAAVAGSVADEVLEAIKQAPGLTRAAVNNGGDIALYLTDTEQMNIAISSDTGEIWGKINLSGQDPIKGIATSGRGGRSLSMGIADSVTVLADTAASADAAATLIANSCDLPGHPAITRERARDLQPDSDLGTRLVVTGCQTLTAVDKSRALDRAQTVAQTMVDTGLIAGGCIFLQGRARVCGTADMKPTQDKGYLYA